MLFKSVGSKLASEVILTNSVLICLVGFCVKLSMALCFTLSGKIRVLSLRLSVGPNVPKCWPKRELCPVILNLHGSSGYEGLHSDPAGSRPAVSVHSIFVCGYYPALCPRVLAEQISWAYAPIGHGPSYNLLGHHILAFFWRRAFSSAHGFFAFLSLKDRKKFPCPRFLPFSSCPCL